MKLICFLSLLPHLTLAGGGRLVVKTSNGVTMSGPDENQVHVFFVAVNDSFDLTAYVEKRGTVTRIIASADNASFESDKHGSVRLPFTYGEYLIKLHTLLGIAFVRFRLILRGPYWQTSLQPQNQFGIHETIRTFTFDNAGSFEVAGADSCHDLSRIVIHRNGLQVASLDSISRRLRVSLPAQGGHYAVTCTRAWSHATFSFQLYVIPEENKTGITQQSHDGGRAFSVFPNPSSSSVTLSGVAAGSTVDITDSSGKSILVIADRDTDPVIKIDALGSGIYYVRVQHNGRVENRKLYVR